MLELSSLQRALAALESVYAKSRDRDFMDHLDGVATSAVRAGVIQHFEFTYELCWKMIKRWLQANVSPWTGEGATRRELYRLAAENLLIADVDQWMKHHENRNLVSHTYVPAIATQVYEATGAFLHDARRLLTALEAHND